MLSMAARDDTWKFWHQFVLKDCLHYLALFTAIRCRNWNLRVSALKCLAPVFEAYDRTTYQQLIPNHLADIQSFPESILKQFQSGAFAVSFQPSKGHGVAFDEAHEMAINKDMKSAVVHASKAYLQKTSMYLRFRISAYRNFLIQAFPDGINQESDVLVYATTPEAKKVEENIKAMMSEMDKVKLFSECSGGNRGQQNFFSGKKATPEQTHDLLNYRKIGSDGLEQHIKFRILKQSTTEAPKRKHQLLTMAAPKKGKKRYSQRERELKQVNACLRKRLAWCNLKGEKFDPTAEQYSKYPRVICSEEGKLRTGNKSTWTDKLQKKYSKSQAILHNWLPSGWVPEV